MGKLSQFTNQEDDDNLSLEEISSCIDYHTEQYNEIAKSIQDDQNVIKRTSDTVLVMESVNNFMQTVNSLTANERQLLSLISQASTTDTGINVNAYLPSMESMDSQESIANNLERKLSVSLEGIGDMMEHFFKKYADLWQHQNSIFNFQSKRITGIRRKMASVKNKNVKVDMEVKMNKFFMYGESGKFVKDTDEFVKMMTETNHLNAEIIKHVKNYSEDTFGDSWKVLFSLLPGADYRGNYLEMFNKLEYLTDNLVKLKGFHKVNSSGRGKETYSTDVLLGMSHVVVTRPIQGSYDNTDYKETSKHHSYFDVDIYRDIKFDLGKGSKLFTDVTFDDVTKLVDSCQIALDQVQKLRPFSEYINGSLRGYLMKIDKIKLILSVVGMWVFFLNSYNLAQRSASILLTTESSAHNFSNGCLKAGLLFAETVLTSRDFYR